MLQSEMQRIVAWQVFKAAVLRYQANPTNYHLRVMEAERDAMLRAFCGEVTVQ